MASNIAGSAAPRCALARRRPRARRDPSAQIDRVFLQQIERYDLQRRLMRPGQADLRRLAGIEGFLPARGAQAPAIAGLQAGKAGGWHRGRQIVAGGPGKGEELGVDPGAYGMDAEILGPSLAAAGAIEAGQRLRAALGERFAKHITWIGAAAGIGT